MMLLHVHNETFTVTAFRWRSKNNTPHTRPQHRPQRVNYGFMKIIQSLQIASCATKPNVPFMLNHVAENPPQNRPAFL
jgi:hypothetical protein